MKLLLVDDDEDFRSMIEGTSPSWLEVVSCSSTRAAVKVLASGIARPIEVSMIDLRMEPFLSETPDREGLGLLRWMAKQARITPSILVSADHDALRSLQHGTLPSVMGFLPKPIDLARLYRFLHAFGELFHGDTDMTAEEMHDGSL